MEYWMTPAQAALYDEGHFTAWRIEEDILEDLERRGITEEVIVLLDTGAVAFALTPAAGR